MGNALQYILKLQDMLSPGMRAAASVTNTVSGEIASKFQQIGSGGKTMSASVDELRERLDVVNKVRFGTKLEGEFNIATKAAQKLEGQIKDLEGREKNMGSGFGGMLGGLTAGFGVFELGKSALGASAERESNRVNMGVMTGSQKTGDKLLNDITTMSDSTPFESKDLLQSGQMLLQFGATANSIMPTLKQLGDISGGNAEKLGQLTLAFGKVSAEGKLSGRELEEMIYAGFNPLTVISEKTGISMANLRKAMEHGAITTDMVQKAMDAATGAGGRWNNLMKKNSETLGGQWSTFMDRVHHKLRNLGDTLSPIAKGIMEFGTNLMSAQPYAIAMASAIGVMVIALNAQSIATKAVAIGQWALDAAMNANPIGLIVAGIAALVAGLIYAYHHFETFRGIVWGAWEGLKAMGTLIKDFVVDRIMELVKGVTGIGQTLYLFFTGQWKKSWEAGKQSVKDLLGVGSITHALENGKKVGQAAVAGYHAGVASLANKGAKVAGVDPTTANAVTGKDFKGLDTYKDGTGKEKADKINNGGQRSIVINVGKQIEKLEMHIVGGSKEVAEELHNAVADAMRRVLYSVNGAVTN